MRILGVTGLACLVAVAACSGAESAPADNGGGNDAGALQPVGDDTTDDGGTVVATDSGKPKGDSAVADADTGPFTPAPHPSYPQVPSNGTVMHNPKIVSVVAPSDTLGSDLLGFGDALVASNWWKVVGADYGIGTPSKHVKITGAAIGTTVTMTQMRQYIATSITGHADAQPDGNTIYLLYLPKGTNDVNPSTGRTNDANCSEGYGGYHINYGSNGDAWGFARRCPTQGTGMSEMQSLTNAASHEIIESATDPIPGQGVNFGQPVLNGNVWEAIPGGGEVGDLCNEEMILEGLYTYTRVWSNSAAASSADPCLPAITPYFSAAPTTPTQDGWYNAVNGTATIPITGFSTARMAGDWGEFASPLDQGITATVSSGKTVTIGAQKYAALNNAGSATLTVTGGQAGQSVVIELVSRNASTYHLYPVGVRF